MDLSINAEVSGWKVISDLAAEFSGHSYVVTKANILGRLKLYNPNTFSMANYLKLPVSNYIPKILDMGTYAGDSFYISEFSTAAVSLSALGQVQLPAALGISKSIAVALTMLHDVGCYHGAIHPDSVYWDGDSVILYDFGVGGGDSVMRRQTLEPSEFLDLPEELISPEDFMSADVARLAGILFFLNSGEYPGTIKKVHYSPTGNQALDTIFSRSFCWLPADRLDIIAFRYYLAKAIKS